MAVPCTICGEPTDIRGTLKRRPPGDTTSFICKNCAKETEESPKFHRYRAEATVSFLALNKEDALKRIAFLNGVNNGDDQRPDIGLEDIYCIHPTTLSEDS